MDISLKKTYKWPTVRKKTFNIISHQENAHKAQRDTTSYLLLGWLIKQKQQQKQQTVSSADEDLGNWSFHTLLARMLNVTLSNSLAVPQRPTSPTWTQQFHSYYENTHACL